MADVWSRFPSPRRAAPTPAFQRRKMSAKLQDLGNFQKLHPGIHHHRFHAGRRDLGLEFVENDMMNHEGKANRRFPRAAQVRIHPERSTTIRWPSDLEST